MNADVVQLSADKVKLSSVDDAIAAIQKGGFVVVADDEARENEGDLVCAASSITPEMVNFMAREARGLICVAVTKDCTTRLQLNQMTDDNTDPHQTAFTVSVDAGAEFGVTTGISAIDRAKTIRRLSNENAVAADFRRPGHVFPVLAQKGGVLRRPGHTEAACDFARLAGLPPIGVMCEIMNDDGSMARRDDLAVFARKHDLPFVTVAQLIQYRILNEAVVTRQLEQKIDTKHGSFTAIGYLDTLNNVEHVAFVKGSLKALRETDPVVRIQQENTLSDILGETSDDYNRQMAASLSYIDTAEQGVVIALRNAADTSQSILGTLKTRGQQGGKPRQLKNDGRDYGAVAQILADLGIKRFRNLSDETKANVQMRAYGLKVTETIPLPKGNYEFSAKPKAETPTSVADEPSNKAMPKMEARVMTMKMGGQIIGGQNG